MWGIVGIFFRALRLASNLVFYFEAQRLVGFLIKPTGSKFIEKADTRVVSAIATPWSKKMINAGKYKLHTLFAGDPSDPPLVLIHGHSMNSSFWYRNIDEFVKMGYYVIAFDLLGWGRSDRPEFTKGTVEDCLTFFVGSFNAWRITLELTSFSIVSHSIGAYVAYEYARLYPKTVKRLTMICPAAIEKRLTLYRAVYFTLTPQTIARRFGLLAYLFFELKYPKEEPYTMNHLKDLAWQLSCRPGPSGDVVIKNLIDFEAWNKPYVKRCILDNLERLSMPVHIIAADFDVLVPPESVERLAVAMQRTGTTVTFDMAFSDHCPFLEVPNQFHEIVAKYHRRK